MHNVVMLAYGQQTTLAVDFAMLVVLGVKERKWRGEG